MDLQTPKLNTPSNPEQKNNWFASHMIVGYVFLFAILAAAVSGIYYWQTVRQIPSSVQFPVHKDVTASWKTYTNTQYGFEFKYPSDWSTRDESTADTNPQTKFNNVRILKETGDNNYLYIEFTSGLTESSGVVNTYPRGPDISAGGIDWKTNIGSTGVGAESSSIFLNTKYGNRFYYI